MAPNEDVTTSNSPSANGSASASASTHSSSTPWALASRRPDLEVLGRQVRCHHLGPCLGGADRRVARPGGDIEHALLRPDPARRGPAPPQAPRSSSSRTGDSRRAPRRPGWRPSARGSLRSPPAPRFPRGSSYRSSDHLRRWPRPALRSWASAATSIISRLALTRRSIATTVAPAARPDFARTEHLAGGPVWPDLAMSRRRRAGPTAPHRRLRPCARRGRAFAGCW